MAAKTTAKKTTRRRPIKRQPRETTIEQIRAILAASPYPLPLSEIQSMLGRHSEGGMRSIMREVTPWSRKLNLNTHGMKPTGYAMTEDVLNQRHPGENGSTRPTSVPHGAVSTAGMNGHTRGGFTSTPYRTPDGAAIIANSEGHLFVARPLAEARFSSS